MKLIDNIDLEAYNEFVKNDKNCNIFQSPQWTSVKADAWSYKRLALVDNDHHILATAQILIRSGLWYLNRGPILDYTNYNLLGIFLEKIKQYAKENGAKLLKIDIPEAVKDTKLSTFKTTAADSKQEAILNSFKKAKFKHKGFSLNMSDTIQPRFEATSYLDENFEENLPKHTKRLLKDVDKRFVKIKCSGKEGLDDLMFALACTEKRKNISLRNRAYFENLLNIYDKDCLIYTAYIDVKEALDKCEQHQNHLETEISCLTEKMHKKQKLLVDQLNSTQKQIAFLNDLYDENNEAIHILCAAISVRYGNSSEMLYAGMNDKFSKIPAQYKVYVETMKRFFELGSQKTSMGGVEGSLDDGLLVFKSHFNPNIVEHYGEFDYAISKTYQLMYDYGLPLRRKILKLLKR